MSDEKDLRWDENDLRWDEMPDPTFDRVPLAVLQFLNEQPNIASEPSDWRTSCDTIFIYRDRTTLFVNWAKYKKGIVFTDDGFFIESKEGVTFKSFEAAISEVLRTFPFHSGVDYHIKFGEDVRPLIPSFSNVYTVIFDEKGYPTFDKAL